MCRNYIFVPLACEVSGAWCTDGLEFLNDLGSRISDVTGDKRDTDFLFQRLSIALQRGTQPACASQVPWLTRWSDAMEFDFITLPQY